MSVHKWRRRPTKHFGEVWVPFAQIEIQGSDGKFQAFSLQIDSGAVVSLLRRSVADLLGLELEAGRRIEVTSVGGTRTAAHVHDLQTRFAQTIACTVPFAIATTEEIPNLLGRLGVFDPLQVDFDGTLQETRITPPWLDREQRRIWEFLLSTEKHILAHWKDVSLPDPVHTVVARFLNRAEQVMASAVGLMKLGRCYAGPSLIRTMFELAMQFEYLMRDPEPRAQRYMDFTYVTRHKQAMAIADNPSGPVGRAIAESPLRPEGEPQLKAEYERVRPRFLKGTKGKVWDKWYCMSTRDLAREVGWLGEYRLVYAGCSAWAHGDPFSTQQINAHTFSHPRVIFTLCSIYYGRMLLTITNTGLVVLSSEQYEFLRAFVPQFA